MSFKFETKLKPIFAPKFETYQRQYVKHIPSFANCEFKDNIWNKNQQSYNSDEIPARYES